MPWLVGVLGLLALWVDIPKHRVPFPFDYPGIRINVGDFSFEREIKTHLGLDLQGGTQLVLQLVPKDSSRLLRELNEETRRRIDRRINELGVSEPVIQALGDDKILVELPGISNLEEAKALVTRQGFLEFKVPNADTPEPGDFKPLDPPLTGENFRQTYVQPDQLGRGAVVVFEFGPPDDQRWIKLTKDFEKQAVEINLDGRPISAPVIQNVFTSGRGEISGNFTLQSAKELSILLNSGALPVPLEVVQSTRIDATLGQDSISRSLVAGVVGLLLVAAFMILYYRLPGALAVLALLYYAAIVYAVFRLIPVTLTLAGIAGFILSIGMAVDANILTFERLKEELRSGKSLRSAVEVGRERAFPSIFFSNAATIISSAVLFWLGTGTVKGFALTLGIGVVVSFFSAMTVTQLLLRSVIRIEGLRKRRYYGVEEHAEARAA